MTPNPEQSERLLALAARCEAADGQDDMIDEEITVATKSETFFTARLYMVGSRPMAGAGPDDDWRNANVFFQQRAYTASLDAAMTLIPAQYRLGTLMEFDGEGRWAAKLFNRGKPGGLPAAGGSSAALAIVVACLRARAGQATPHTAEE